MIAKDVYKIAKALSNEEFYKLFNMLKDDIKIEDLNLKSDTRLPNFTQRDALKYLLEKHIRKHKKIV